IKHETFVNGENPLLRFFERVQENPFKGGNSAWIEFLESQGLRYNNGYKDLPPLTYHQIISVKAINIRIIGKFNTFNSAFKALYDKYELLGNRQVVSGEHFSILYMQ
ncbi:MAG: hypothetical protein GYA36_15920, partial [Veillonellaceae bacterium]|nr:hypothetical protein [Veillonellaceae bacterium]